MSAPATSSSDLSAAWRSASAPLTLAYTVLVVYASLYPFEGWVDLGVPIFDFVLQPWPRYWIASDLIFNVIGYLPLGFLAVMALQRHRPAASRYTRHALAWVVAGACLLSLSMETLQNFLPQRVSSNVDWGLNTLGTLLGGALADGLRRAGLIERWNGLRRRWFDADARGVLVLMVLWPAALLFPAAVPLGVGQVAERLSLTLADWVEGTAYADWISLARMDLEPLTRLTQAIGVGLGLLLPILLGYAIVRPWRQRLALMPLVFIMALAVLGLSSAMSYGPGHAWVWLSDSTQVGLAMGLIGAVAAAFLPRRVCLLLLVLAIGLHVAIVNQAPTSPYLAETLQVWERGQFIHFNGLAQWMGWLWPVSYTHLTLPTKA